MSEISVNIETAGATIEGRVFPDDYLTEQVISECLKELNLSTTSEGGQPVSYSLVRFNDNATLREGVTLYDSGVRSGDTLRLISSEAGPRSTSRAADGAEQAEHSGSPAHGLKRPLLVIGAVGCLVLVILFLTLLVAFIMRAGKAELAEDRGGNIESAGITTVERFPTVESPDEVFVGKEFAVQVSLTKDLVTPGVRVESGNGKEGGRLSLHLPDEPGRDEWKIDVILSAPGFSATDGTNISSLRLPRVGDSTPAVFRLRPKSISSARQTAKLYATFWLEGDFLAKVSKDVSVVAPQAAAARAVTPSTAGAPAPVQTTPAQGGLVRVGDPTPPDLTVYVLEDGLRPEQSQIIIESPYLQPSAQGFATPPELPARLEAEYQKFAGLSGRGTKIVGADAAASSPDTRNEMRGFGRLLYDHYAPQPFKEAFWKLVDKLGLNFKTIQIYTNDPVLPWELMCPARADGSDERSFLGVEFALARWHVGEGSRQLDRPPRSLALSKLVVIAPAYGGGAGLPAQDEEVQTLEKFPDFVRLPGQVAELNRLFADPPQGIIHFAGHGAVKTTRRNIPEYSILLEDGALDLTAWRGMTARQNGNHPFFFLNACEVGQSRQVANTVDGWAPAVLEAGASGYIGALWPIGDKGAADFASQFYKELGERSLDSPVQVAEVLRDTRRQYLANGDPTFLAYVYYGDTNLRVNLRPAR